MKTTLVRFAFFCGLIAGDARQRTYPASLCCNCSRRRAAAIAESFAGTYRSLILDGGAIENPTEPRANSAFAVDIH
jgi:hypothetical protein